MMFGGTTLLLIALCTVQNLSATSEKNPIIGCYENNRQALDIYWTNNTDLETCKRLCRDQDYSFAGVDNGTVCYCGDDIRFSNRPQVDCEPTRPGVIRIAWVCPGGVYWGRQCEYMCSSSCPQEACFVATGDCMENSISTTSSTSTTPSTTTSTVTPSTVTPSTVTPSTVTHSTVTSSTVTPSTVTPSTVTPSTVTPSTVTPSTVTRSTVTPSTVTPSTVTPSTVTPSTVTPSTVTPSTVTPSTTTTHPSKKRRASYIRWGRTVCPSGSQKIYNGYMVGSSNGQTGGGANYLCAHESPQFVRGVAGHQSPSANIYGVEFEIGFTQSNLFSKTNLPAGSSLNNQDIVCAVCYVDNSSDTLLIPGRQDCAGSTYNLQYKGFLMSAANQLLAGTRSEFICVDEAPEGRVGGAGASNQGEVSPVEVGCGSLSCPSYQEGMEMTCAVCTD